VECDIPQLARNNYFTGKLLVERDFTDEQRYLLGKLRRHNQRLHGWGAVCGLKVKPHPTCPDRYVIIEPGTAIDCCGREILVGSEEYFGFEAKFLENWQKQNGPNAQPDNSTPHKIQICVSYKECGTEDIPALFDDCNCDATSCQPNRILESYCFDVLIDPKSVGTDVTSFQLDWSNTLHFANAVRVAESDATKRLYILTSATVAGTNTATLYQLDTTDYNVLASATFANSAGLDVAVSPAGDVVYVAVQPSAANTGPQISVCDPSNLAVVPGSQFNIGTTADSTVQMGVVPSPNGPLLAVGKTIGVVAISGLNSSPPAPTQNKITGIANPPVALAISPGGQYAYVADASANVSWITLSSMTVGTPAIAFPAGAAISSIAAAETTTGDTIAALDLTSTTPALYFATVSAAGPASATVLTQNVTGFAFPPMQVLLSPGGQWAYVLEQDTAGATPTNKGYVQVVNEHAVETSQPGNPLGAAMSVGMAPKSLEISQDGGHLYIPFTGQAQADNGGVAVLDVLQTKCCDPFQHVIDCPDCSDGNCVVLATIDGYKYGQQVLNTDIDNVTDRHFLVSTTVLTEVVKCLCDEGGGTGKPGKDGAPGTPGLGIDKVNATFVPCDQPGSASITGTSPNRTLNLVIPGDCNKDLVGVANVSWAPPTGVLGKANLIKLIKPGLRIAFTGSVQAADLANPDSTSNTVILLAPVVVQSVPPAASDLVAYCEVPIRVRPGNFSTPGDITSAFGPVAGGLANGLNFSLLNSKDEEVLLLATRTKKPLRVLVKGDFVRDSTAKQRGLDGNHLPPWVPARPSGDGIEGGTFESWFTLEQQG